jgi:serine O-acetyltransferase
VSALAFGVDIHPRAQIGPGLVLRHAHAVVIGRGAVIGRNVHVFHGVTLGNRLSGGPNRPDGFPVIGDDAILGAGAIILGPVHVGERSWVGAGVVLTRDVPPDSVVRAPEPEIQERPRARSVTPQPL